MKEGKAVDNRYLSGRRRFVRTASMVKRVRERIRRHPQRSARRMACQLGISDGLLRRIIKEDLGLKPYKKRKVHGLTDAQKEKRLVRSKQLLERHGSSDLEQLVFFRREVVQCTGEAEQPKYTHILVVHRGYTGTFANGPAIPERG